MFSNNVVSKQEVLVILIVSTAKVTVLTFFTSCVRLVTKHLDAQH